MKEIVMQRLRKEAYKASFAWCCMCDAKEDRKEAMKNSWREHIEARWLCWELLEAAGVGKTDLWNIEREEAERAYEDYKKMEVKD